MSLILLASITFPHTFANEYCFARQYDDMTHEQAIVRATKLAGGHYPELINDYCDVQTQTN